MSAPVQGSGWRLRGREISGAVLALGVTVALGVVLEALTALRRVPMTDLGVFAAAARDGATLPGRGGARSPRASDSTGRRTSSACTSSTSGTSESCSPGISSASL